MLSSAGIGSGLDINSLVTQLVSAESEPKTALFDKKEAVLTAKISAYGLLKSALSDLKSSLSELSDSNTYNTRTATSSDKTKFSATADTSAVFGSYDIEITQLAEAHKLSSAGFTDSATVVGTGTLTLSVGTDSFSLTIDDNNKSLAGIRDSINNATDNTGVTATIINVDDGVGGTESRLVLTSNETGSENSITVEAVNGGEGDLQQLVYDPGAPGPGPGPGTGTTNLVERNPAQDAIVLVDNQAVTSSSNQLSNVIDGISISLLEADPGTTLSLNVELNSSGIENAVEKLVANYNAYIETQQSVTGYAESGSGALIGDALARSATSQIRQQLTQEISSISGEFSTLASIGITSDRDGFLSVDSSKLTTAITEDITSITNLFTADDGIATKLESLLDEYVKSNGIVDSKTTSLNDSIQDITDQRERFQIHIESYQARILQQFITMDTLVAQLNATSDSLAQALSNLPEPNSIKK